MNTVVVAFFLAGLTACPKPALDFGPRGEIRSADELLELTQAADEQVVSVEGEGRARIDAPQGKGTVGLFLAVARPSLIHLESLDFFGKPQAVLVSAEGAFALYSAQENRFYRGPATGPNIARFLPVVLPPEELVAVMLGQAPRIPDSDPELEVDSDARAYRVTLKAGDATQRLWIDPKHFRVLKSEIRGVDAYDLVFDDFQTGGAASFPKRILLKAAAANTEVELRYTDATLNGAIDLTLFELEPPPNVPVVEVDAEGRVTSGFEPAPAEP